MDTKLKSVQWHLSTWHYPATWHWHCHVSSLCCDTWQQIVFAKM